MYHFYYAAETHEMHRVPANIRVDGLRDFHDSVQRDRSGRDRPVLLLLDADQERRVTMNNRGMNVPSAMHNKAHFAECRWWQVPEEITSTHVHLPFCSTLAAYSDGGDLESLISLKNNLVLVPRRLLERDIPRVMDSVESMQRQCASGNVILFRRRAYRSDCWLTKTRRLARLPREIDPNHSVPDEGTALANPDLVKTTLGTPGMDN